MTLGAVITSPQHDCVHLLEMEIAGTRLRDQLTQLAPIFAKQKFMLGDEFSMLDVAIAPLLWRLEHYAIELPKTAAPANAAATAKSHGQADDTAGVPDFQIVSPMKMM